MCTYKPNRSNRRFYTRKDAVRILAYAIRDGAEPLGTFVEIQQVFRNAIVAQHPNDPSVQAIIAATSNFQTPNGPISIQDLLANTGAFNPPAQLPDAVSRVASTLTDWIPPVGIVVDITNRIATFTGKVANALLSVGNVVAPELTQSSSDFVAAKFNEFLDSGKAAAKPVRDYVNARIESANATATDLKAQYFDLTSHLGELPVLSEIGDAQGKAAQAFRKFIGLR